MKKTMLLLTILYASILNGMYSNHNTSIKNGHSHLESLSSPAKNALTSAFATNNLNIVIDTLKKISDADDDLYNETLYKVLYVLKYRQSFKELMHILARNFNMAPYQIAEKFKTPVSKEYVQLYEQLKSHVLDKQNITRIKELMQQGADITADPHILLLAIVAEKPTAALVQLLLAHGANPHITGDNNMTPLELLNGARRNISEYEQIKTLLENAMKK